MLMALVLCALVGDYDPRKSTPVDHVNMIEVNHVYNELGNESICQLILWEWKDSVNYKDCFGNIHKGLYVVVQWYRFQDGMMPQQTKGGNYQCLFFDYREQIFRIVKAESFVETYTIHDPEVTNSRIFPRKKRRKLSNHFNVSNF